MHARNTGQRISSIDSNLLSAPRMPAPPLKKEKEGQSIGYYTKQKQINKELFRRQVRADIFVNKAYEEWMHDVGYDGKALKRFKHNLSEPEVIQQQLQQVTMLHMVRSIRINN